MIFSIFIDKYNDLVYVLHSIEYVLGLAQFRVFVPKLLLLLCARNDFFTVIPTFTRNVIIFGNIGKKCSKNNVLLDISAKKDIANRLFQSDLKINIFFEM